jgi:alpha-1,2-mannosyltransferase
VNRRASANTATVVWTSPRSPLLRVLELWFLIVLPIYLLVGTARSALRSDTIAYDFDRAYLPAVHLVLHGLSPYGPSTRAALSSQTAFVYPPIGAFLAAPFAALPHQVADIIVTVLAVIAVPLVLALVGIRDWRCLGAAVLWMPTFSAIHLGAVSVVLALGIALAWRWREHSVRTGLVVGLVVALKLFLWPLLVWLVITRRYKAAAIAAFSTIVFVLAPWIPLQGAGLLSYPHRLSVLSSLEAKRGFSPAALLAHSGLSWTVAQAVGYALGITLLALAYRRRSSDESVLGLVCAASLLLTPILWPNYLMIMLVPFALLRPRFGALWLLPAILFGQPAFDPPAWEIVVLLGVLTALTLPALGIARRRPPQPVLA